MQKFNTRKLTLTAMFVAVSIILARLLGFYLTETMRVSFEYFTIILAGLCLGPAAGAIVGGLSDFLGATVLSGLGFFPPLILGPIGAGFCAGIIGKYAFRRDLDRWWKPALASVAADVLFNLLWGTYALTLMSGTPYLATLAVRAPLKCAIIAADAFLVIIVHRALRSTLKKMR